MVLNSGIEKMISADKHFDYLHHTVEVSDEVLTAVFIAASQV